MSSWAAAKGGRVARTRTFHMAQVVQPTNPLRWSVDEVSVDVGLRQVQHPSWWVTYPILLDCLICIMFLRTITMSVLRSQLPGLPYFWNNQGY
jgi:hypothetical protein